MRYRKLRASRALELPSIWQVGISRWSARFRIDYLDSFHSIRQCQSRLRMLPYRAYRTQHTGTNKWVTIIRRWRPVGGSRIDARVFFRSIVCTFLARGRRRTDAERSRRHGELEETGPGRVETPRRRFLSAQLGTPSFSCCRCRSAIIADVIVCDHRRHRHRYRRRCFALWRHSRTPDVVIARAIAARWDLFASVIPSLMGLPLLPFRLFRQIPPLS